MKLSLKNSLTLLVCCAPLVLAGCKKSSTPSYSVSVTVSGLVGSGLVMQLNSTDTSVVIGNGSNTLTVNGNGVSTFPAAVSSGVGYSVTIRTQPGLPPQTCTVTNNVGTISGSVDIPVTCPAIELAYLTNSGGNSVAPYVIDTTSGVLTGSGPATPSGATPVAFALSASGRYAYAVNYADNTVSAYLANPAIGLLTTAGTVGTGTVAASATDYAIAVDPGNQFVYITDAAGNGVTGFAINSATAALSCVGSVAVPCPAMVATGSAPSALAVTKPLNGVEYVFVTNANDNNVSEYAVGSTGALTAIGTATAGSQPVAIAASPVSALVLVANAGDSNVSAYTNVAGTLVSNGAPLGSGGANPVSIAIAPAGNAAYVLNAGGNSVSAYTISGSTLTLLATVPTGAASAPASVSVDPSGAYVYVTIPGANSVLCYAVNVDGTLANPVAQTLGNSPVSLVTAAIR